jgi:glycosyltransferase involved in cell wall biosynthesis
MNNRMPWARDDAYEFGDVAVHRIAFHTKRRTPLSDIFDWRIYRAARDEIRSVRPDLVHVHNVSGTTLAPYLACRAMGIPVVNTLHDLWLLCPNNSLYRPDGSFCSVGRKPSMCRRCFRQYDFWANIPARRAVFAALTSNVRLFISPSQAVIDRHVEAGFPPDRFRLVRHGFAEDAPAGARDTAIRRITGTHRGYRTVTFAGGGVQIKGPSVLLEALPALLRHIEGLRVLVAGGGEREILEQFLRYAPVVQLVGRVPFNEMRNLFAAANLTVVPSICHESSSVVAFESFQAGTPVAGSDFGGIPELIREGRTGYLFSRGDAVALAEKVVLHFARPARERRWMRQRCVEEVRTRLGLGRHIDGVLEVYQEALGN